MVRFATPTVNWPTYSPGASLITSPAVAPRSAAVSSAALWTSQTLVSLRSSFSTLASESLPPAADDRVKACVVLFQPIDVDAAA